MKYEEKKKSRRVGIKKLIPTLVSLIIKDHFDITILYYNPNIEPYEEYEKRKQEQIRIIKHYNIKYLPSDFKKENGYKKSIELSNKYRLYRQNYCGCIYSRKGEENE